MGKNININVISLHVAFWLYELIFVFITPFYIGNALWFYFVFACTVYLHYIFFIPKIIKVPNLKSFVQWFILFFIITIIRKQLDYFIAWHLLKPIGFVDISSEFSFYERFRTAMIAGTVNAPAILGLTLGSRYFLNKTKAEDLERQKIKNELNTLKNQIDIRESIKVLDLLEKKAKINPESIQNEIIQLSNILRYHLYSKDGEVFLSKELEIVNDQLSLHNKLNGSNFKIKTNFDEKTIQTGILSKTLGEALKVNLKMDTKFELRQMKEDTFLSILNSDKNLLLKTKHRIEKKFMNKLNIQTTNESILIKLN